MHEGDRGRVLREALGVLEGVVAAAHHQHALSCEAREVAAHVVRHAAPAQGRLAGYVEGPPAYARRGHHGPRREGAPEARHDHPQGHRIERRVGVEVYRHARPRHLGDERVGEGDALHQRQPRHVVEGVRNLVKLSARARRALDHGH
jgi:hypothetical protein